jgi:hypothetical protein
MYIVSWTLNQGLKGMAAVPDVYLDDSFQIFETEAEANSFVEQELLPLDALYCWAVSKVLSASEPHWMEDVA